MGLLAKLGYGIKYFFRRRSFGVSLGSREFRKYYPRGFEENSIWLDNIYNKIANDVALLKFKHVKVTNVEDGPDKIQWQRDSGLSYVLNVSPNNYKTPFVFWSDVVRRMLEDGIAVVIPTYEKGEITTLNLAEGIINDSKHSLTVVLDEEEIEIDINSLWIFENPKKNITTQLYQVTRVMDENLKAVSWKVSEQGNFLKGLLHLRTNADDQEMKEKAEERVNNILDSARDTGVGYLQKGEEFQELTNNYATATPEELNFLKTIYFEAFGFNEKLFTCSYTEEEYRAYFSSILKVYQRVIDEEINRKAFSKTARTQGHKIMVYFDMFDISSLKDLNDFAFKTKYGGILNANEIREILGYGGYEGGDVYETNKNALPVLSNENNKDYIEFLRKEVERVEQKLND